MSGREQNWKALTVPGRSCFESVWIWFLAAVVPALLAGLMIQSHWVDVPCWDDWERGVLLKKVVEGTATFSDFYAPHIQHRIVVPRALLVVLNQWSGGDLRWEMAAVWVFVATAALLVALCVRRTLGTSGAALVFAFGLAVMVVHPIQYQNFLWAVQTAMVLPAVATLAGGGILLFAKWRPWIRWNLAALCALVATHSFSHGLLAWPVLLAALLFGRSDLRSGERPLLCCAWLALMAAVFGLYFNNLESVSHPSHAYGWSSHQEEPQKLQAVLADPVESLRFLRILLGSFWSRGFGGDPIASADWLGGWVLGLFLLLAGISVGLWRKESFREGSLPWILIGSFGLLSCAAVVVGRMGILSVNRGISPRYISLSLYVSVAILGLAALLLLHFGSRLRQQSRKLLGYTAALVGGFLITLLALNGVRSAELMGHYQAARYQAAARLAFIRFLPEDYPIHSIDATRSFARKQAEFLNSREWLRRPLLDAADLGSFRIEQKPASSSVHRVTSTRIEGDLLHLEGEASTPGTRRPADLVVLCRAGTKPPEVVAFAKTRLPWGRPINPLDHEFDHHELPPKGRLHLWSASLPLEAAGDGLEVWILDARKWRAHQMKDPVLLPLSEAL